MLAQISILVVSRDSEAYILSPINMPEWRMKMKNVDSNQYGEIRGRLITKVGQEFGLRGAGGRFSARCCESTGNSGSFS